MSGYTEGPIRGVPVAEHDLQLAMAALREWFHGDQGYAATGHDKDADDCCFCCESAEVAVEALAAAGRLLPADMQDRTDYEIDWIRHDDSIDTIEYEGVDEDQVWRELDAARSLRERHPRLGGTAKVIRRREIRRSTDGWRMTGPWVPVDPPKEGGDHERG